MNIPNICHFVFGMKKQTDEFLFCYYVAVYSAHLINSPDKIHFYYHYEPHGIWWDKLKEIPSVKLEKVDVPTHIGRKPITKTAHKADWIRMNMLFERGGIYLDIDTICVKPWKHLLYEDVVLGKEAPNGVCNAIMFSKPKSKFFRIWLHEYESHFNPDGWREASIVLPETISKKHPQLATLKDPDVFFLPYYTELDKVFFNRQEVPSNLISLHLWETFSFPILKEIQDWSWAYSNPHTMYGKMLMALIRQRECQRGALFGPVEQILENVFYINLDDRVDRRVHVEQQLDKMGWKYSRFPAIKKADGRLGCSMSHLKIITMAQRMELPYVCVVEDDILFRNPEFYKRQLKKCLSSDVNFDVLLIAGNTVGGGAVGPKKRIEKISENVSRVYKSFTTTGYIVKRHYYDTLISNFKSGILGLMKSPNDSRYVIDMNWFALQENDNWIMITPRTVTQLPGYSSIEKRKVCYDHVMLD